MEWSYRFRKKFIVVADMHENIAKCCRCVSRIVCCTSVEGQYAGAFFLTGYYVQDSGGLNSNTAFFPFVRMYVYARSRVYRIPYTGSPMGD